MAKIVIDPATQESLRKVCEFAEVADSSGKTVGFFVSTAMFYELFESPSSDQESNRRAQEPQTDSTPDLLEYLIKL